MNNTTLIHPKKTILFTIFVLFFSFSVFLAWGASALNFFTNVSGIDLSPGQRFINLLYLFGFGYYVLPIATISALEIIIHGYKNSSLENIIKNKNGSQRDIFFLLFFILISKSETAEAVVTIGISSFRNYFYEISTLTLASLEMRLTDITTSIPLLLFLSSIIYDFAMYIQHRIAHELRLLWAVHRVHHSAEEMTLLNWGRDTVFGNFLQGLIIVIPVALISDLGITEDGNLQKTDLIGLGCFIIFSMFISFNRFMSHSNLQSNWGWIGRYIVVSPAAHRIHHSVLEKHFNKNYGSNLIIWDHMFGTYYDPDLDSEICPIGIKNNPYNKGNFLYNYIIRPIADVCYELKKLIYWLFSLVLNK